MNICNVQHSSKLFSRDGALLTAEASTLAQGSRLRLFGQVYDDACDEGFVLVSARTGDEAVFVIDKVDYQGNGEDREIAGWYLVPTAETVRKLPRTKGLRVLVIND